MASTQRVNFVFFFQVSEKHWYIRSTQQGLVERENIHHVEKAGWKINCLDENL